VTALALAERPAQGALFGADASAIAPAAPAQAVAAEAAAPAPAAPATPAAAAPLDGPTLDDVVSHAWEALGAQVAAACPVCGGEVEPHGYAPGGRCTACDSALE
jgi:hypothetical protein